MPRATEDGTLHRLGDSAVCIQDTVLESLAHLPAGSGLLPMQTAADAMNDLRKDDTGISTCPHDGTGRGFLSDNANRLFGAELRNHAVHGLQGIQHIVPCITIGTGKTFS